MTRLRTRVEALLGRVTMYRLVTIVLLALVAVYTLFTATGVIEGVSTTDNLVALVVLVAVSWVSNRLVALVWRVRPHGESAIITGLLLFFLFAGFLAPTASNLGWLAAAAALANASKYVLAWRGRHVLNPAAAGAALVVLLQDPAAREVAVNPVWIVAANEPMLPFLVAGALLVLWRTGRLWLGLLFVVVAVPLYVVGVMSVDGAPPLADAVRGALVSAPVVFFAGFMLSEPLTLPPRRWQQAVVAVVAGVVFALPLWIQVFTTEPSTAWVYQAQVLALLAANVVAFALARRTGVDLETAGSRRLEGDTWEVAFRPRRPVRFVPGQYLELHLPHAGADSRGVRRVFSISSAPSPDLVTVALRVPERSSSFKSSLVALPEGHRVRATGVHGDFVWPRGAGRPLLLVAGGIGITPFLSQLRAGEARDVVLVHGVPDADAVPYRDELVATGVRVVLVSPEAPADLPDGWTHVAAPFLTAEVVDEAVPDASSRVAYLSGPPAMVDALRGGLRRRCAGLRTDAFTGY